jgi:hypothetical protein
MSTLGSRLTKLVDAEWRVRTPRRFLGQSTVSGSADSLVWIEVVRQAPQKRHFVPHACHKDEWILHNHLR